MTDDLRAGIEEPVETTDYAPEDELIAASDDAIGTPDGPESVEEDEE